MKLNFGYKLVFLSTMLTANFLSYAQGDLKPAKKKALIFGVTGQDGAYLAELLLGKDYEVHAVKRRSSSFNTGRIDHLYKDLHGSTNFILHYGDLADSTNIVRIIQAVQPDEIYNLAAQSHVKVSFETVEYTSDIVALGVARILEAILISGLSNKTKFYQASSSEMYGLVQEKPQTEKTPFYPRSPYAVAKLFGFWETVNYREREDKPIFACNGILFNHESPLRGETFVTRKITMAVARIKQGLDKILYLGNLDASRDWGYAKDYVEAMWLMLQQDKPDDYVIATGETHTVREFVELAFKEVGVEIVWQGQGLQEIGINKATKETCVAIDAKYFRPTEVDYLLGDSTKAYKKFGWKPKTTFKELVSLMVQEDLKLINK
ncbi:MAG: GDP-mannose 4,6-dehydratase [Candidatus Babeliales bacterium]|nr:GDP-mannose 4,6-dehydratase [Candidatus Babeliales bacterium]